MIVKEWWELGYKTIFCNGMVYLYRPLSGVVISTPIDGGKWQCFDDVNRRPWHKYPQGIDSLPESMRKYFQHVARECYCGQGVDLCDLCAGLICLETR